MLRDGPVPVRGGPGPPRRASTRRPGSCSADADGGPRRLVISSDFYAVYESAGKKADGLVNLYCWAHLRRHFVRAGDANPAQLRHWTDAWLDRIRDLYAAHDELMAAWQEAAAPARAAGKQAAAARLEKAHAAWDDAITVIDETRKKQMTGPRPAGTREEGARHPGPRMGRADRAPGLPDGQRWTITLAERTIRGPVVTRKNAGGSHNGDTARNAAVIWTVTATAADGRPEHPDLPHRLPRRMRPQRREAPRRAGAGTVPALERQPRRPPHLGTATARPDKPRTSNTATGVAASDRHAGHRHALSQDFRVLTQQVHDEYLEQQSAA